MVSVNIIICLTITVPVGETNAISSNVFHSVFCFLGGNSLNNLIELKTININPTDTTVPLLSDCTEVSEVHVRITLVCNRKILCCKRRMKSIVVIIKAWCFIFHLT